MPASSASVLVVDDEPEFCSVAQAMLGRFGFRCLVATDPHEAKQLLDSRDFTVLVADVVMPEISGLDLLAYVRRTKPACRVILVTGLTTTECLADALKLGAYDFIQKPFAMGELTQAVARAASGECPGGYLPIKAAKAMKMEDQVKQASLDSIRALVYAVEAKDPYTRRHSEQVTHYATSLAQAMGMPFPLVESVRVASLLHDVGKIGIPDEILTKPGALNEEEFAQIRRHPDVGAEILQNISMFAAESHLVRCHHERWDGSGYPHGLAGEEIPLGARVINVADSIDAMLMQRTYKSAYPVEKMLQEVRRSAGTHFDPQAAATAIEWCRRNPEKMILTHHAA